MEAVKKLIIVFNESQSAQMTKNEGEEHYSVILIDRNIRRLRESSFERI